MHLTLRHKVNGAIIITFILIALISAAIQFPFQQHRMQKTINHIEVLLQTLVERDTEQLANEIFDARLKAIQIRITQMKRVEGILGIFIFDQYGKILVSDREDKAHQNINSQEQEKIRTSSQIEKQMWLGIETLLYSKEISFLGEKLGFIRIYYSLEAVKADQRITFFIVGSLLLTILVIMLVVLNLIISKAILNPIMYLRDATQFIAQGNLDNDINMSRKDELGNLAESFEKMRDAIKEKISDLEQLSDIINSTSDLVSRATPDSQIIYLNMAGRKMVGWPENIPLDNSRISDLHPAWAFKKINTTGIPEAIANGTWTGETSLIDPDGKEIPVSQVIISHLNSKGEPLFISTIMRDISKQKKAEEELRYLRNYLKNIIDSMPSLLIGIDSDSKITQWNSEAHRTTGIPSAEAIGQLVHKVFPRLTIDKKQMHRSMRSRQMISNVKHSYQVNEETYYEDVTLYPLISDGLEGAVIRIDDVTEKVRMEELMIQSEKMLSVGGLAAGMAHEINNPLAGMMQAASVLTGRLTDVNMRANQEITKKLGISMNTIQEFMIERDVPKMLDRIRDSGKRASIIVTNMLSFARKSDTETSAHNLPELVEQTIDLAGSDYDLKKKFDFRQIEIIREYDESLPDVPCDSGKIQQVLLNLLRNGAEAMQERQLAVNFDGSESEKYYPKFIFRLIHEQQSENVRIEIEDNGPGMNQVTRKRIFEPFFTTKPTGSGTGLGLSVSYFIITENHNGTMSVESMPGQGTKFIIYLPVK